MCNTGSPGTSAACRTLLHLRLLFVYSIVLRQFWQRRIAMRIISFLAALFLLINIAAPANAQVVNVNVATATEDYEYYGQVTLLAPGNVSLPFPDPANAFVRGDLSGAFNAAIA